MKIFSQYAAERVPCLDVNLPVSKPFECIDCDIFASQIDLVVDDHGEKADAACSKTIVLLISIWCTNSCHCQYTSRATQTDLYTVRHTDRGTRENQM